MPLAYAGGSGYVLVSLRAYAGAFFRRLCAHFVARIRRRFFRRLCAHFVARIRRRRCLSPLAIRPDDIEILQKAIDVRLSQ